VAKTDLELMSFGVDFGAIPLTSGPGNEIGMLILMLWQNHAELISKTTIGLVPQSEHRDETEEIATEIEHILRVTGKHSPLNSVRGFAVASDTLSSDPDLSKSPEIQPGERLDPSCYIAGKFQIINDNHCALCLTARHLC